MECQFPEVNTPVERLGEIFSQVRVIAVVGLSPDETKDSYRVASYLQQAGFKIVPIYPKEEMILGEKVYRSLEEIPFAIDMVDVFRKADVLPEIVASIKKRGDVKVLWTQVGIVNNEAAREAEAAGVTVVQSRCAMVEHRRLGGGV
ncbi:MAG: CoA-binding protein [Campylobacterales bacterium]